MDFIINFMNLGINNIKLLIPGTHLFPSPRFTSFFLGFIAAVAVAFALLNESDEATGLLPPVSSAALTVPTVPTNRTRSRPENATVERAISTATFPTSRITMPESYVRLSAGRRELGEGIQALCFFAGANSIFYGDKLLTTGNPDAQADRNLMTRLGIVPEG